MKSFRIVPFVRGSKTSFYTIHFEGEQYAEAERFIMTYQNDFREDVQLIVRAIDRVANKRGAFPTEFRDEGKSAAALPLETSKLRLYCLRISRLTAVLGYGGVKRTRTYQEDPELYKCVKVLEELDRLVQMLHREADQPVDIDDFVRQLKYSDDESDD